jgi:hypothetical protein
MKKMILALIAIVMLATPGFSYDVQRVPLAVAYDLDGLGVDANYNVLATQIADSKSDYTISAQNEVCRINNVTLTDADGSITVGVVTVTGTDCWGDALVCTTNITGGSGAKTLAVSSGTASSCAFKTITQVANGVVTGEAAGDNIEVGYPALAGYVYPIHGVRQSDAQGQRFVNPFAMGKGVDDVTVNGTALASFTTADGGAFQNLAIGDLVYLTVGGKTFERRLTNVASDDAATMDVAIPTAAAPAITDRVNLQYKKRFLLREDRDAWVPIGNAESFLSVFDVDANVSTGGVVSSVECGLFNAFTSDAFDPVIAVDTATVATGSTGTDISSVDLRLYPYSHCRVGVQFGTTDDGDGAPEDINIILMISKEAN